MLKSNKIWGVLILSITGAYISAATYKDPIGLWNHWNVLYIAYKINAKSDMYIDRKLELNERAILSAAAPWSLVQRIKLLQHVGKDSSFERERLKTLWNTTYEKEIAK